MNKTHLLEINLISAQNLKPPSTKFRKLQTYAVVYINPNKKLRTRVNRVAAESPTWNDKFIFRVTDEFLSRETSAVNVDIYAVGVIKDDVIGSVRLLISNVISPENRCSGVPAFVAVQVRRNSGRFHGVLNVGAAVIDGESVGDSLSAVSAIGFRDMMGVVRGKGKKGSGGSRTESLGGDSVEFSDGTESSVSSKSSTGTTTSFGGMEFKLKGKSNLAGDKGRKWQNGLSDKDVKAFGSLDVNSGR